MNGVLITCDPEFEAAALEELAAIPSVSRLPEKLETGDSVEGSIYLIQTEADFDRIAEEIRGASPIFLRHIAPVQRTLPLAGTREDLETFQGVAMEMLWLFDPERSFSVQSRILGTGRLPYRRVELNESISDRLTEDASLQMDCKEPEQVFSILCTPDTAYLGVSLTEQNRSAWPGGKHRFRKEEEQISRAEFKLMEALAVFGLSLPTAGTALDIGAAPGGWTRILAARGLKVDAVDPAELDPRLYGNPLVRHHRKRIQEYSPGARSFDVIVNDMKMDARDSIDLMARFSDRLDAQGVGLMTLKLPRTAQTVSEGRRVLDMVRLDLEQLRRSFHVIGARQLYHNRSEVTVAVFDRMNVSETALLFTVPDARTVIR